MPVTATAGVFRAEACAAGAGTGGITGLAAADVLAGTAVAVAVAVGVVVGVAVTVTVAVAVGVAVLVAVAVGVGVAVAVGVTVEVGVAVTAAVAVAVATTAVAVDAPADAGSIARPARRNPAKSAAGAPRAIIAQPLRLSIATPTDVHDANCEIAHRRGQRSRTNSITNSRARLQIDAESQRLIISARENESLCR